ncbi:MAG TPA: hypothetical protein VJA64_03210, partial [Desulfobaccales bacterium]|nr:hypothetical protein [Desulfobaccales bacterium]
MQESGISAAEALSLLELAQTASRAQALPDLAESFLHSLERLVHTPAAVLYLADPAPPDQTFFQKGLPPETVPIVRSQCAAQFQSDPTNAKLQSVLIPLIHSKEARLSLSPLHGPQKVPGLLGVVLPEHRSDIARILVDKAIPLLAYSLRQIIDRLEYERQISNLNIYLNVSSMI